jgi:hypothetical protein
MMKIPLRCIYCGKEALTWDHIPSKSLLEKPYPNNLITVPACSTCNNSFSTHEEYLLNILVGISSNPTLTRKIEVGGNVYRAWQRSDKLKNRIYDSIQKDENGRIYIKPEHERVRKVLEKNALGLYYHRYKVSAKLESFKCTGVYPYEIIDTRPAEVVLLTNDDKFMPKRWTSIQKNVFDYIVVRDWRRGNKYSMIFNIHNTLWALIEIPFPNYRKRKLKTNLYQLNLFDL